MKSIIFLFSLMLCSCVSLPKKIDICETDAEVIHSSYEIERYISDKPFKIAYYPTIKLNNLGNQCEEYISKINEVGDYFSEKLNGKSMNEMQVLLNKEKDLYRFKYMLPSNGKHKLEVGRKIRINVYQYKKIETIFSSTFFSTKIRIAKIY